MTTGSVWVDGLILANVLLFVLSLIGNINRLNARVEALEKKLGIPTTD